MKKTRIILAIAALVLTARSVFAQTSAVPQNKLAVYVAGTDNDKACYWKDGVKTQMSSSPGKSTARAITVAGGVVYVAGQEDGMACYWKNGEKIALASGDRRSSGSSEANAIAVLGSDVYVWGSGAVAYEGEYAQACYWKNGESDWLNYTDSRSSALGASAPDGNFYVVGEDRYVARAYESERDPMKAVLWKNGMDGKTSLYEYASAATAVAVADGVAYVAGVDGVLGGDNTLAALWVLSPNRGTGDTIPCIRLSSAKTSAAAVAVAGKYVYVAGYESDGRVRTACYWRIEIEAIWRGNARPVKTGLGRGTAAAIAVAGNDVYVAGEEYVKVGSNDVAQARLWKNGAKTVLANGLSSAAAIVLAQE